MEMSNSIGRPRVEHVSRANRSHELITRRPWSEICTSDNFLTIFLHVPKTKPKI